MRRHVGYANVAATLALVLSMTGGALAAKHYLLSSTAQIKPSVLKKLRGATGRTGGAGAAGKEGTPGKEGAIGREGPAGKAGTEGKPGPVEAVVASLDTVAFPASANAAEQLVNVKLKSGPYTITATVSPQSESGAASEAECILLAGATELDDATVSLAANGKGSLALTGTASPAIESEVALDCKATTTSGGYKFPHLIATRVSTLG